jgi:hypothetical protein
LNVQISRKTPGKRKKNKKIRGFGKAQHSIILSSQPPKPKKQKLNPNTNEVENIFPSYIIIPSLSA